MRAPLVLALLFCAASCVGNRKLTNPTLALRTPGGQELGVSTDYGVVFLGHTAQSGRVEIETWFGDGPSIEPAIIEPVGAGLYTAETEIRLPHVPLTFDAPRAGTRLLVVGLDPDGPWEEWVEVVEDPRVLGLITTVPDRLRGRPDQIGAGVYVVPDEDDTDFKRLLGLYAGELRLTTRDGERSYMAIVGPTDLWRLVAHRRDLLQRKRWVYREDVL